jgi:hypothetical protein
MPYRNIWSNEAQVIPLRRLLTILEHSLMKLVVIREYLRPTLQMLAADHNKVSVIGK